MLHTFVGIYFQKLKIIFRLKRNDIESVKPGDMMTKLTDDVEFALNEYNEAIEAENQAQKVWNRRKLLDDFCPSNPTAEEELLLKETADYFRQRFKNRMRVRIKKKETYDKRVKAKEQHKENMDVVDRKENWVYTEGSNFNIRWSALPRYLLYFA